jgi:UDP-N-acetylglucosamine 2-epimerase (non-hydrolysing)
MAPLYHEFKKNNFDVKVVVTAQHRQMLDQVLDFFEITPDFDLNLMQPNQSLNKLSGRIISEIDAVFKSEMPDLVLVHGDTTTSTIVALAAFHLGIKVAHVEAGLRTYDKKAPFPEEINRQITSKIADFHFTPTQQASDNLINEQIPESIIFQTGNTIIDALFWTVQKIQQTNYKNDEIAHLKKLIPKKKKIILVTGHRRENFGDGFLNLCEALLQIAKRDDVIMIYPVHLNPNVKDIVYELLSNNQNILLINPIAYPAFVWLMQQSFLILSDSGGIQEEAPSLGKPVLVTRTVSERPEGLLAGFSKLVGTDKEKIILEVKCILDNFEGFKNSINPYGNGDSSKKIVDIIKNI